MMCLAWNAKRDCPGDPTAGVTEAGTAPCPDYGWLAWLAAGFGLLWLNADSKRAR